LIGTSRRTFLRFGFVVGSTALLAACGQAAAPTAAPAKPTEAPKPAAAAEPTKPAGAPAATTAPVAAAAPKPGAANVTLSFWNGLTGADGQIMDQLIGKMTGATGVKIDQQRIPWADLFAKIQIAVPAGEGPDQMLTQSPTIPGYATDGIFEAIDDKVVAEKGFKADDYIKVPWEAGIFQGKRYAIPLDVPQHILYMNEKLIKDAGLDPKKPPATKDELFANAKKISKGDDVFGFVHGAPNYTWAFHNWLWQNGGDVFTSDLKKAAVNEQPGIEAAELLASLRNDLKISPPGGVNLRDAFLAGKTGYWWAGSWNLTGLPEMKFDWSVAPTPTFFKNGAVWTISHNYVFPKPKTKDDARRDAAWTHVAWIRDNVADWTALAGQISAYRKAHDDPKVTSNAPAKVLLGQANNWRTAPPTVKWTKAESLQRPFLEKLYLGTAKAKDAMDELAKQINAIPD
jgi:multiple sugar transport system substrate-binding protein